MTTHVFIVDSTTFKVHLEYQFAGTGAKDSFIDFNASANTTLYHITENNLVGMIADSQRVRIDDYVIFYLQQNVSQNIYEGKFYGIFKIKEDLSFLDNNDSNQFLKTELKKSLTFRTFIKPYEVYSKGVTEWEALDEIRYIQSPNQMLWSLIYRKLKGNRGNTMITIYESERLFKLLRDKNSRQIEWIGNEVSCGVGMQRIDLMLSIIEGDTRIIMPIELKAVEAKINNIVQLQRYVDWLEQYYIPNRISDIQPVLISKKIEEKTQPYYNEIIDSFANFNDRNTNCLPLKYIEYELQNNNLEFEEIEY